MESEKRKKIEASMLFVVTLVFLYYNNGSTCRGAQMQLIFCFFLFLTAYWRLARNVKQRYLLYYFYAISLFAIFLNACLVYNICLEG
jgi:hypothetical protein